MANITIHNNPFALHKDVEVHNTGTNVVTIRKWLNERGIEEFKRPTICIYNGEPILRARWGEIPMLETDQVSFVAVPQGGGGGRKIIGAVLMIAVVVAAPYLAGAIAPSLAAGSAALTGLTAAIAAVGTTLVNVLVPPPSPTLGPSAGSIQSPSPTYSVQAQGNQARIGEPIPVVYGRHVVYPNFASQPYHDYSGNDQFLYQTLVIGQGECDIEAIRIEDTPISSFKEISTQIVRPGQNLTLFDDGVITSSEIAGQELLSDWIGPFVLNPSDKPINKISVDITLPRGLYYANDNGSLASREAKFQVQVRQINQDGNAVGSWQSFSTVTIKRNQNTPVRLSYSYNVSAGRYEVRVKRMNAKDTSTRVGNDLHWSGLRGHLVDKPTYDGQTILAMKMQATDNLSSRSSRQVNCIVTRKLPTWSADSGWSEPVATRSIAWAMADILRSDYGAKLTDDRIDLASLQALDAVWQARGDTFDGVFDSKLTVWDALSQVARCGRAVPFMQGGVVRFVRNDKKVLPTALFSTRNIVKDSFSIEYVMPSEDTADSVTVKYFNEETWKPDEVTASVEGSTTDKPASVALFGCTNRDQALREGLYMAAANRYRRRIITFRTELEGLIPTYGDLIAVSHDMPQWGIAGDVVSYDSSDDSRLMRISEHVDFAFNDDGSVADHFIIMRKRDGSASQPYRVEATDKRNVLKLLDPLDFEPYTGSESERTHFSFGRARSWAEHARVISVRPRGEEVEITAVAESDKVYDV